MDIFTASASAINSAGHFAKNLGQMDTRTERRKKVELAVSCFEASGADGIWVVDSTLDDHASLRKLENQRLPELSIFMRSLTQGS